MLSTRQWRPRHLRTTMSLFRRTRRPPRPTLFPYTTLFRSYQPASTTARVAPTAPPRADASCSQRENARSEEHTSELQSLRHLVCRLLLEKKKRKAARCGRTSSTWSAMGGVESAGDIIETR